MFNFKKSILHFLKLFDKKLFGNIYSSCKFIHVSLKLYVSDYLIQVKYKKVTYKFIMIIQFYYWNILFIYFKIISAMYLDKIICELQPYYLTILTKDTLKLDKLQDLFFRKLSTSIPTYRIHLLDTESTYVNDFSIMPSFQHPRESTIYIIFETDSTSKNLKKSHDILNLIVKISSVTVRPKSLLILPCDESISYEEVKNFLRQAWTFRFLDFCVLKICNDRAIFFSYNPFMNNFTTGVFKNSSQLFPDKLNNVNQYLFKLSVFNSVPSMAIRSYGDRIIEATGNSFAFIETIVKKMNFKLHMDLQSNRTVENVDETLMKLKNNEISMSQTIIYYDINFLSKKLVVGYPVGYDRLAAVGPIKKILKIDVSSDVLINVISFPIILITLVFTARFLKFYSRKWKIMYTLQILIGYPISHPRRRIEKIIFLSIAVSSMIYSNNFFLILTGIKFNYDEMQFYTFEDLLESKMPIYSYFSPNQYDNASIKSVFLRTKKLPTEDCIDLLIKTGDVICILIRSRAEFFSRINLDVNGKQFMKIFKVRFPPDTAGYAYEKSSPFAEKIEKTVRQIIESDLLHGHELVEKVKIHPLIKTPEFSENSFFIQINLMLFVGFFSATILFLYELRYHACSKRRNKLFTRQ